MLVVVAWILWRFKGIFSVQYRLSLISFMALFTTENNFNLYTLPFKNLGFVIFFFF